MTKQLNEAVLASPTFCGDDQEITAAMNSWTSIISSISYMSQPMYPPLSCSSENGMIIMSAENQMAILNAVIGYATSKLADMAPKAPVMPAPAVPSYTPPVNPMPDMSTGEVEITYEGKEPNEGTRKAMEEAAASAKAYLKRMRELAGVPHPDNHV